MAGIFINVDVEVRKEGVMVMMVIMVDFILSLYVVARPGHLQEEQILSGHPEHQ